MFLFSMALPFTSWSSHPNKKTILRYMYMFLRFFSPPFESFFFATSRGFPLFSISLLEVFVPVPFCHVQYIRCYPSVFIFLPFPFSIAVETRIGRFVSITLTCSALGLWDFGGFGAVYCVLFRKAWWGSQATVWWCNAPCSASCSRDDISWLSVKFKTLSLCTCLVLW